MEKTEPFLVDSPVKKLFFTALLAFKKVNTMVFGVELSAGWRDALKELKDAVHALHSSEAKLPITPKLHVLTVHVEQWLERHQQGLGLLCEQALEAAHHIFKRLWENFKVTDEESKFFLEAGLRALLKFNADNA